MIIIIIAKLINFIVVVCVQGVLSLRFTLSNTAAEEGRSDIPPGLIPAHKQSIVLFLERVYGMDDKELFFSLLEHAFLLDLRAATSLDKVSQSPTYLFSLAVRHHSYTLEAPNLVA